jgi:hypothetical protein
MVLYETSVYVVQPKAGSSSKRSDGRQVREQAAVLRGRLAPYNELGRCSRNPLCRNWLGLLLAFGSYVAWVVWGVLWLFRRKLNLLRRYPGDTNDDLIRAAKAGDAEAQYIRRNTWVFVAAGLVLGGLLALVRFTLVAK